MMNILASLLLLFALLIGLPLAVRLFTLRRRGGCIGLIATLLAAAIPGLFVAGSVYLDVAGTPAEAAVTNKQETIKVDSTANWYRHLTLNIQFQPDNASYPETLAMDVDAALYDQLHTGQSVPVHYINPFGLFLFARLTQQNTFDVIPWNIVQVAVVVIGAVLVVWLWSKRRFYGTLAGVVWLLVFAAMVTLPSFAPRGEERSATADVKIVRHFTEVNFSTRRSDNYPVTQPFDIVQLSFTPQGLHDPVIAVDVVDSDSVRGLEVGGHIPITYPVSNPRAAQIEGAARTHYWKNPAGLVGLGVVLLLILLLLSLVLSGPRKLWKRLLSRQS